MADVFTPEEVHSLNEYQNAGVMHPFTCGSGKRIDHPDGEGILVATTHGWVCPYCDFTQDWAHGWMKDGSWMNMPTYKIQQDLGHLFALKQEYFTYLALGLQAMVFIVDRIALGAERKLILPSFPRLKTHEKAKELLAKLKELGIMPEETDGQKPN